jgi:peptidoglycan/LPS O-acetylase OafA/YrhL
VSSFFTLSGFLITRLLVDERRATGTIDLGRFWTRRVRRLMPASLVTLGLSFCSSNAPSPPQGSSPRCAATS